MIIIHQPLFPLQPPKPKPMQIPPLLIMFGLPFISYDQRRFSVTKKRLTKSIKAFSQPLDFLEPITGFEPATLSLRFYTTPT